MAAVTVIRRATGKAHPTSVLEGDTILVGGLELSSAGTASIYTDAFVTAITIGGGAQSPDITIGDSTTTTTVPGDLVIQGTTTSVDSEVVNIADNHLYLNKDYTTTVAQTGGLVVNYLPTATNDSSTTGGFATTSTVNTTGAATFTAGDFIQINGAANAANDGLYEVLTHSLNVLTIDVTPAHSFSQTALTVDTTDTTAVITQVTVAALQAGTDGIWETGAGSTAAGLSFSDIGSGAGNSLQAAYVQGNAITMTNAEGGFDVSVTSGTPAISLDAAGASNFTVASASLTLATTTAGDLNIDGAGILSLNSSTTINLGNDAVAAAINIGTGAAARTVTMGNATGATALNLDAGTGGVAINATATADISLTVPVDAASDILFSAHGTQHPFNSASTPTLTTTAQDIVGAINEAKDAAIGADTWAEVLANGATSGANSPTITSGQSLVGAAELTLVSTTTGAVILDSGTTGAVSVGVDAVNAKTVTVGASAGASTTTIDSGTGGANFGTTANAHTTTLGGTTTNSATTLQAGTGAMTFTAGGIFDVNATGAVTIDGAAGIALEAATASSFNVTTGALTLSTTTSGNLTLSTTTAGDVIVSSSGAVTIDGLGVSIDGTADSNLTLTAAAAATALTQNILVTNTGTTTSPATINLDADSTNDTGTVAINATGAANGAINIGTDASAQLVSIGNTTGATAVTIDAGTGGISLGTAVASDFTVTGATADLTLGARGGTITLNESGQTTLDAAYSATSIIGALNEVKASSGGDRNVEIYTTALAAGTPAIMSGDAAAATAADASAIATVEGFIGVVLNPATNEVITSGTADIQIVAGLTGGTYPTAGDPVYLSTTTGRATTDGGAFSPPNDVIYQIGIATDASAVTATTSVDGDLLTILLRPFVPVEL